MKETDIRTATANSQRPRLINGGTWRNFVAGLVERALHSTAWLLRPRHIPKQPIGNRRRNGHFSSLGRRISSVSYIEEQTQENFTLMLK